MRKNGVAICGGTEKTAWLHARAYRNLDTAAVRGVFFDNATATVTRAESWGFRPYSSFNDVLSDSEIGIIEMLYPLKNREELIIQAIRAGKNVLIAPPFSSSRDGAKKLLAVAKGAASKVMCGENLVLFPPVQKLISLASKKTIGRITAGRFRTIIAEKGGWDGFLNPDYRPVCPDIDPMGIEDMLRVELYEKLSLSQIFLGPIDEIHLIKSFVDVTGTAVSIWKNTNHATYGCMEISLCPEMNIRSGYDARDDNFELTGAAGIMWLTRTASQMKNEPTIRIYRGENQFSYGNLDDDWIRSYEETASNFAACVAGTAKPAISLEASAKAAMYVDAALGSAEFNRRVKCG